MADTFRGDNAHLCECIDALLSLDASGSMAPHGVGVHERTLLESASTRLRALSPAGGDVLLDRLWAQVYDNKDGSLGDPKDSYRELRKLLTTTASPAGGDWVMVPREPTPEMRAAGERERLSSPTNMNPYHVWAAMLAASPQQEPVAQQDWKTIAQAGVDACDMYKQILADRDATIATLLDAITESCDGGEAPGLLNMLCLAHDRLALAHESFDGEPDVVLKQIRAAIDLCTRHTPEAQDPSGQTLAGAGGDDTRPHPRWNADKTGERHPQTVEAWDWSKDNPGNGGGLERSRLRLNVAADFDDPRAPDQMALVLRIDLIRILSALTWRTAQVKNQSATSAGTTGDAEKWIPDEMDVDNTILQVRYGIDYMMGWNECRDSFLLAARRAREVGK